MAIHGPEKLLTDCWKGYIVCYQNVIFRGSNFNYLSNVCFQKSGIHNPSPIQNTIGNSPGKEGALELEINMRKEGSSRTDFQTVRKHLR